jgi:hypothetical protein
VHRSTRLFALLVTAQGAHSVEEYVGRLWETFPPARWLTSLVSSDGERGFLALNILIVVFGIWCLVWPVRRSWPSAAALMWGWTIVEAVNGVGHPLWALLQGGYAPGVLTAPALLGLALALGRELRLSSDRDRGLHPPPRPAAADLRGPGPPSGR